MRSQKNLNRRLNRKYNKRVNRKSNKRVNRKSNKKVNRKSNKRSKRVNQNKRGGAKWLSSAADYIFGSEPAPSREDSNIEQNYVMVNDPSKPLPITQQNMQGIVNKTANVVSDRLNNLEQRQRQNLEEIQRRTKLLANNQPNFRRQPPPEQQHTLPYNNINWPNNEGKVNRNKNRTRRNNKRV